MADMLFAGWSWDAERDQQARGKAKAVLLCSTPVLFGSREKDAKVPSRASEQVPLFQWITKLGTEMAKSQGSENIGPEDAFLAPDPPRQSPARGL